MISKHIHVRYTARGCDWHVRGMIEGTWDDFDRMEKVFTEMERRHEEKNNVQ